MAAGAVFVEQLPAARDLRLVDAPEQVLGPRRRLERLDGALDALQVLDRDGRAVAIGRREWAGRSGRAARYVAPVPTASPMLRAIGWLTEALYCTQSNFQMFHMYG